MHSVMHIAQVTQCDAQFDAQGDTQCDAQCDAQFYDQCDAVSPDL